MLSCSPLSVEDSTEAAETGNGGFSEELEASVGVKCSIPSGVLLEGFASGKEGEEADVLDSVMVDDGVAAKNFLAAVGKETAVLLQACKV